jgi:two-component system OmpR family sensor kinase
VSSSLVERVGLGAASASALAARLAAIVTSVVTAVLVHRLDDRRLRDAAMILAELEDDGGTKSLEDIIADEIIEVQHTGILLALVDDTGKRVAGDVRVPTLHTEGCVREEGLDVCAAPTTRGVWAVSAQSATPLVGTLMFASMIAAALAALASWLGSRPFARWLIAPLLRLRDHVAGLDVRGSNLGGRSGLSEVDALRDAIEVLMKRVEAAIHTAERFAADAAHELRTPLTALRGELELFVETDPHAGIQRAATKVVELQGLIECLLVLARPTSGAWTPPDLVAMDDLTNDIVGELDAGERVRVEAEAKLPAVRGDTRLLSALMSNVLANALKFGTRAEVRMRASSDALIIEVQDDGPGVAGELRERVFEPFYRGAAHPNVPGHGLGLAVVANVVQRHNGVVSFLDTSSGACIQIRLPIA